jgi:hypothetical protein
MDQPGLAFRNTLNKYGMAVASWTPSGHRTQIKGWLTDIDGWTTAPFYIPAVGLPDLVEAIDRTRLMYDARAREALETPGVIDLSVMRRKRRA